MLEKPTVLLILPKRFVVASDGLATGTHALSYQAHSLIARSRSLRHLRWTSGCAPGRHAPSTFSRTTSIRPASTRLVPRCCALAPRQREIIGPVRAVLLHGSRRRMCEIPVLDAGKVSPARTEWLTPAEADALINAAAKHLQPLLTFLAATGARLGEALALDWRDVDLPHLRAVLRDTKNGRDRILDLCPRAAGTLAGLSGRAGRVFRTRSGEPYKVGDEKAEQGGGQIKKAWATARKKAGLDWKDVSPHSLRHTWASWHYAMHRDLLLLRFEGDWSSVKLVERYAHLVPPSMADEVRAWRAKEGNQEKRQQKPEVTADSETEGNQSAGKMA